MNRRDDVFRCITTRARRLLTADRLAIDTAERFEKEARSSIQGLLFYIEELEEALDSSDRELCIEGGCGSQEWDEESDKFMPRDQRLSYIRDDHVASLESAKNFLGWSA